MMMKSTTVRVLALVSWGRQRRRGFQCRNRRHFRRHWREAKDHNQLARNWIAQFLIPGRYGFTVTAAGFKQAEAPNDHLRKLGTNVATFSVPTAVERQGDFTQSFTT